MQFQVGGMDNEEVQVVQSLAKWKRLALAREYDEIEPYLPDTIAFVHAEDLRREFGAVFDAER